MGGHRSLQESDTVPGEQNLTRKQHCFPSFLQASVFTVLMDYQQALPGDGRPGRPSPPLDSSAPPLRDELYFHLELHVLG